MKICIIGPQYPWGGGIAKYLDSLGRELNKNYNVVRVTFSRQYPRFLRRDRPAALDNNMALPLNTQSILDTLNPLSWPKVAEYVAKQEPDLIIFKYWNPYFALCFGYLANKLREKGSKICFVVDNVYPHEVYPFSRIWAEHCLGNGNLFITHSKKVTKELIELVPTAFVKEIPHPAYDYGQRINIAQARHKLLSTDMPDWGGKPIILFFGYIRPYKGLDTLLHAFTMLQGWKEDAILLIAGESFEKMDKYKALASALGISDKVIWHDHYIPDEQIKLYFSAADLLVLPYKETTQSGIVEIARNFDLPVIATNTGGLPEQVKVTVPPDDPEALFEAMARYFTDSVDCGYKQQATTFEDLAKTIMESLE